MPTLKGKESAVFARNLHQLDKQLLCLVNFSKGGLNLIFFAFLSKLSCSFSVSCQTVAAFFPKHGCVFMVKV